VTIAFGSLDKKARLSTRIARGEEKPAPFINCMKGAEPAYFPFFSQISSSIEAPPRKTLPPGD
jgi:hypothetical protein